MNSRRYAVASIAIAFMAVTLLSVPGFGGNAYAAGTGMSLSADANYMSGKISVSGVTDRTHEPVTIQVTNSNGIHAIAQADTSSGNYSAALGVQDMDGSYTIIAQQGTGSGKYKLSVDISASNTSASTSSLISGEASTAAVTTSAPAGGLTISAADSVEGSTTIDVSGTTDRGDDITLKVIAPNGNVITTAQLTPSGGDFMTTIETGGALWSQDGMYTISAYQAAPSKYQASAQVEVIDGHVIPEFGTIAVMILVVAIVSIIIVSAKTKLSLVPRY